MDKFITWLRLGKDWGLSVDGSKHLNGHVHAQLLTPGTCSRSVHTSFWSRIPWLVVALLTLGDKLEVCGCPHIAYADTLWWSNWCHMPHSRRRKYNLRVYRHSSCSALRHSRAFNEMLTSALWHSHKLMSSKCNVYHLSFACKNGISIKQSTAAAYG